MTASPVRASHALSLAVAVLLAAGMESEPVRAQVPIEQTRLDNGLLVVTAQRRDAETVAITLAARAGSRFEDESTASAAHFLEHMYLQGTPDRPSRDAIMRTVTARGGTLSIGTGWEFLDIVVVMAPEDFGVALDLLTDLIKNSLFDPERFEHQRGLILQELAERRDSPMARAYDLFYSTVFRDHELRFLPSGLESGVTRLQRDVLLAYRDTRMVPSNMVLGVVGPQSHAEVVAQLAGTLGTVPARPAPSTWGAPPPAASAQEVQVAAGRDQAVVVIGAPTPGLSHPDRYPLWLLQTILGPGGGRLFYDIRDAHGLAYDTSARLALTAESGSLSVYAGTDPANVEQVIELLLEHLGRARATLVTEEELEDAIGFLVGGTIVGLEPGAALSGQIAHNTVLGLPLTTAELEARLRAVTREDIQRVAREYLAPERLTRVVVRPVE